MQLALDTDLSETVSGDPALDQQLYATFAELSGATATREIDGDRIIYRSEPDVAPDPALTGVGSVRVSTTEGRVVTVELVEPDRLREAIEKATAGEPDGPALALAWQKSLRITVVVKTGGSVSRVANPDDLSVVVDGDVIVSAPLDAWKAGTLQIQTKPKTVPLMPIAVITAIGLFGAVLWRRR